MSPYHDRRPISGENIFNNDFMLSDFAEAMLKGWANSIPPQESISREQFQNWVDKLNHYLDITADAHFKRLEETNRLLEVEKNAELQ